MSLLLPSFCPFKKGRQRTLLREAVHINYSVNETRPKKKKEKKEALDLHQMYVLDKRITTQLVTPRFSLISCHFLLSQRLFSQNSLGCTNNLRRLLIVMTQTYFFFFFLNVVGRKPSGLKSMRRKLVGFIVTFKG